MLEQYKYAFIKGWALFRNSLKYSIPSILTLGTILFLYFAVYTVNSSVAKAVGNVTDSRLIRVFIDDEVDAKEVKAGINRLKIEGETVYFDRAAAKERVLEIAPNAENLKELPEELFPRFFEIKTLSDSDTDTAVVSASEKLSRIDGVTSVESGRKQNEKMQKIKGISGMFVFVLTLLTGLSCVFILFNNIRLSLYKHHRAIMVYTLVGATRQFITLPYVVSSKFEATFAFLFAWLLNKLFTGFAGAYILKDSFFVLTPPGFWHNLFFYVILMTLSALAAIFSVVTFLMKQKSINEI
ncbi:cell division protein FtsX [Seleniivibrio woodruffii]|uniref:Cell division transport system permease protein n=1 Tax=Seleniivibrio woodruffii TaxID=1078050 RepID=A0A4R1K9M2_9BACT|nr:hypothetical protein [Seleniivibrio woodruffii]TCK61054.1 cell division transport system permease protein [Seleniivibrio woodruffii]TVZ36682.1 cell division transport system permease protein [Seleniivibrio woodruffii]